jgi:CRP/FNR family transcriptional regulator, cyclic AMP receptor protein
MLPFDTKTFGSKYGGLTITKYPASSIIFAQGDIADSILYLQEGKVKLSVVSEQGKEAVIAILKADDLFGEGCLAVQPLRIATATTMSNCVITRLERVSVIRATHDDPSFSDFLMAHLLTVNARLNERLIDQLFNSSERRLARALLLLANYGKEERPEHVIPRIDQATLAKMVGTTRARVNHFMNKFRKMGFIEYNGDICVRSSLWNILLHDQPDATRPLQDEEDLRPLRKRAQRPRRGGTQTP